LGSFLAQFQGLAPTVKGVTITVLFFAAIREIVGNANRDAGG
jgi:hypothetical protein